MTTDSESLDSLRAELEALTLEEEALRRQDEETRLKARIAAKRAAIDELTRRRVKRHESGATLTSHDLPQLPLEASRENTPLEDLLAATNLDSALPTTWFHRADTSAIPSSTQSAENQASTTEMFLKPRAIPKGEKPLLIVDFITHIVPQDEEETLGNQGNAKIVVTYGPKKPKLETVTVPQWVVANTRILYALLSEGKLATQAAIQQYLAYTVKIMELSAKFDWKSILMYDNEVRSYKLSITSPGVSTPLTFILSCSNPFLSLAHPLNPHHNLTPIHAPHGQILHPTAGLSVVILMGKKGAHCTAVTSRTCKIAKSLVRSSI